VILNHLPTYHLMHLNSAVSAGATQVLCPGDDTVAAIDAANAHRATRFYSLPVRLLRLADDPRLPELKLASVEAIMSGGSALSPAAAGRLSEHFGLPVTQGYGLAETSPLTHTDRIGAPRIGSVGTVVTGTGCRIVDVESRAVLASGERGEVQVRGPQVMSGYLDPTQPTGIDADGWFSTGDVGYEDEDGYLFLVDRLKDVFKCDNWLVSPTEIEQVVGKHPAVRECVVVDHPDPYRGAVAHAFVVLADPGDLDPVRDWANAQLPYYQHIQHITGVPAIPRSPNGKVQRRDIRAWVVPTP
jgi:long-chain acyl-CoA synthetase